MEKMYIQVERERITTLLDKVRSGAVAIPQFQRDYVWTPKQVVDFFDSILNGWPIGSLLLWVPDTDRFKIIEDLEGIKVSNKSAMEAYVLDGRQRITTLLSVLDQEGAHSGRYYVDLDDMKVVCSGNHKYDDLNFLLLSEAFDAFTLVDYLDRMRSSSIPIEKKQLYANRAKEINKILLNYEIGYIEVHGGDIEAAVQIFSRLNDKSTPVSPDYMIQALAYSPEQDFLFADAITEIKQSLDDYNLGELSRDLILKCAYNYSGKFFIDAKAEDLYKLKGNLLEIMLNVRQDVLLAAEFLYKQCYLISSRLLPYTYQFVMTALFFKNNRSATELQLKELRKWFFYTSYSSYFTNTSLGNIRKDLSRFVDFCEGRKETPMDYDYEFELTEMPKSATLGAVRNCVFAMAMLSYQKSTIDSDSVVRFETFYPPKLREHSMDSAIICCSKEDKQMLSKLFAKRIQWNTGFEDKYGIDEDLLREYQTGFFDDYLNRYKQLTHRREHIFIEDVVMEGRYHRNPVINELIVNAMAIIADMDVRHDVDLMDESVMERIIDGFMEWRDNSYKILQNKLKLDNVAYEFQESLVVDCCNTESVDEVKLLYKQGIAILKRVDLK